MACYIGPPTWYVKKAGDQMTGKLSFASGAWAVGTVKIKTGTYVGDNNDNRTINIGINLTAKNNVYIIIKGNATQFCVHRPEYGQGDFTMRYDGTTDTADQIQGLVSTGFQIGGNAPVNLNGITFRYIVIYEEPA